MIDSFSKPSDVIFKAILVIAVIGVIFFISYRIDQSIGLLASFAFLFFIFSQYQMSVARSRFRWVIIAAFATTVISPTGFSKQFLANTRLRFLLQVAGGISIGAMIWATWILVSIGIVIYRRDILVRLVRKNPLYPLFLMYSGFSILYAPNISEGVQAFSRLLVPYSLLLIFYFYLEDNFELKEREIHKYYDRIAVIIAVVGPILAALGLNDKVKYHTTRGFRYTGLFFTANGYIAICTFLTVYYLSRYVFIKKKKIYILLVAFFVSTGILTRSVGGIAALIAALIVWALFSKMSFLVKIACLLLAFSIGIFLLLGPIGDHMIRYRGNYSPDIQSALLNILRDPVNWNKYIYSSGRGAVWQLVWSKGFVGHEIFGSGAGASTYYLLRSRDFRVKVVHGEYVRLLSEYGILGTILFLGAVLKWMIWVFRSSTAFERAIIIPLFIYLMVNMISENILDYVSMLLFHIMVMLAISIRHKELADKSQPGNSLSQPVDNMAL